MTRTYVYALIRTGPLRFDRSGVEGAPVRVVAAETVAAVASSVADDSFEPEVIKQRLSDLNWVESVARAHDDVVSDAAGRTTTIPLRLGTTTADDASLRALLTDLRPAAERALDRVEGRREFGVQLFAPARPRTGAATATESGAAFLRRRRAELEDDAARRAEDVAQLDQAFDALAELAADARRHPVRERGPGGSAMVVNAAFLIDESALDRFTERVDQLADSLGRDRVVMTGPWAPYSFADLAL